MNLNQSGKAISPFQLFFQQKLLTAQSRTVYFRYEPNTSLILKVALREMWRRVNHYYGGSLQIWYQNLQISQIIKGRMESQDKYKPLKHRLQTIDCDGFNGSVNRASFYYFKMLEELSTDIILDQNDIKQLKNKIQFMKVKLPVILTKYAQKKRKQEQKRFIHCEQDGCKLSFLKEKQLHYHKIFSHEDQKLFTDKVFEFKALQNQE